MRGEALRVGRALCVMPGTETPGAGRPCWMSSTGPSKRRKRGCETARRKRYRPRRGFSRRSTCPTGLAGAARAGGWWGRSGSGQSWYACCTQRSQSTSTARRGRAPWTPSGARAPAMLGACLLEALRACGHPRVCAAIRRCRPLRRLTRACRPGSIAIMSFCPRITCSCIGHHTRMRRRALPTPSSAERQPQRCYSLA